MARACTICTHPERAAIDASIQAEVPNRQVASQYGLSETSIRRHAASHQSPQGASSPRIKRARVSSRHVDEDERIDAKAVFLRALRETGIKRSAYEAAKVDRHTIDRWMEHDQPFALAVETAFVEANEQLRGEILRRAVDGIDEPVISQGKLVYDEDGQPLMLRKYSDTLLMFEAKRRMPEYRDKQQVDITSNGQTVGQLNLDALMSLRETMGAELQAWRQERFNQEERTS